MLRDASGKEIYLVSPSHSPSSSILTFSLRIRGTEHIYNKHFKGIETKVGYTGGAVEDPRYEQVKTGATDHAEALEIKFNPAEISYETLVEFFYKMHGKRYTSLL